jgi:hypothetical protein
VRFASTLNDHQGFLAWVRIPHDAPNLQFLSGVIFLDTDKNRNVLRQVMPWTVLRVRFEAERRQVQFLLGAPSFVRVLARESHAV